MQGTGAMYLTVLVPTHAIKGCFKGGLGSNSHIHGTFHIHGYIFSKGLIPYYFAIYDFINLTQLDFIPSYIVVHVGLNIL
jgi:hypothetical protein